MLATRSAKQAGGSELSTPAGFTRAFHTQTGMTPRQYKKARPVIPRHDDTLATNFSELMLPQLQPEAAPPEASPPSAPATQTWNRINDFHVLVWLYRGAARVMVGERTRRLRRGDAIWLPAGVRNSITLSRGSLLLPLGSRHGTPETRLPRNLVQRFPDEAELYLLHTFSSPITALFALRRTTRTGSRTHFSSMPRGASRSSRRLGGSYARLQDHPRGAQQSSGSTNSHTMGASTQCRRKRPRPRFPRDHRAEFCGLAIGGTHDRSTPLS